MSRFSTVLNSVHWCIVQLKMQLKVFVTASLVQLLCMVCPVSIAAGELNHIPGVALGFLLPDLRPILQKDFLFLYVTFSFSLCLRNFKHK